MYKVLRVIVDQRRKGSRAETGVSLTGEVSDPVSKKAIAEKLAPALSEVEGLEFFDRDSGKIKIRNRANPKKEQSAEEKMVSDFKALIKKSAPKI